MRLLAEENVSRLFVDRLRALGFDVTAIGAMLSGASDSDVLAIARGENRILVTEDRDFGEMVIRQKLGVRGVVLLKLDRLPYPAAADLLGRVVAENADRLPGNLLVIEPGRVRVRPLPA